MRGTGEAEGGDVGYGRGMHACAPSRKSQGLKTLIFMPILGMPYELKVSTLFIKQNFHENGLIFVLYLSMIKTHRGVTRHLPLAWIKTTMIIAHSMTTKIMHVSLTKENDVS